MLSLGLPSTRPVTGVGHNLEHLLIFAATGGLIACGYYRLALLAFSGAVEVVQMMVPSRHARLSDFLTDAAASIVGVGLSFVFVKLARAATKG